VARAEERVNRLAKLDPDRRRFQHVYLSAGLDVVLDPHGRIQIRRTISRARRVARTW
jgi:DNA-binding transcriptional regulator/RsmH inhibitor MraZ